MYKQQENQNIFQIIISSDNDPMSGASSLFSTNAKSFADFYPDFSYHLLSKQDIESVLSADFSVDVQRAFRSLLPYAYKSDLARYCLMLRYGGIYADLSMRLLHPISLPPGKTMACFRDAPFAGRGLWWVSNGLIRAQAGREEFKVAIELIEENCRKRYYGATPVHPTGPALFGRALAMADHEHDIEVGEFRNFSNVSNPYSFGYLDGEGRLVAVRMKSRHLSDLGVRGTNQYPDMWHGHCIYSGESQIFDYGNKKIALSYDNRTENGIVFTEDMGNFICFGPYISLAAGRYFARFALEDLCRPDLVEIDVYVPELGIISKMCPGDTGDTKISFALVQNADGVEIRLSTAFGAKGRILSLEISSLDDQTDFK